MMRKYVYFIVVLLFGLSAAGQIPWNTHFQPRPFL